MSHSPADDSRRTLLKTAAAGLAVGVAGIGTHAAGATMAAPAASAEPPPGKPGDFDFLAGTDEAATKLDLAQAYIDMGDSDGARDILNEVLTEGDEKQLGEAKDMLSSL